MKTCSTRTANTLLFILVLAAGCTRSVRIPKADYDSLEPGKVYRVRTTGGDLYQVKNVSMEDTTVVVSGPLDPIYDYHDYPAEIGMSRVESIEVVESQTVGAFVETGAQIGTNVGDESNNFVRGYVAKPAGSPQRSTRR